MTNQEKPAVVWIVANRVERYNKLGHNTPLKEKVKSLLDSYLEDQELKQRGKNGSRLL